MSDKLNLADAIKAAIDGKEVNHENGVIIRRLIDSDGVFISLTSKGKDGHYRRLARFDLPLDGWEIVAPKTKIKNCICGGKPGYKKPQQFNGPVIQCLSCCMTLSHYCVDELFKRWDNMCADSTGETEVEV